jgi:hypothetical protein
MMYLFWNEFSDGRVFITWNLSKSKAMRLYRFYENASMEGLVRFGWREDQPDSLEQKLLVSKVVS